MGQPFLGEIKIVSFNFAPKNWAMCNGQFLPINQNQALFSLLGTMYGGNGQTTFALPDLRGQVPIHFNKNTLGQAGGEPAHTLTMSEMPMHIHLQQGVTPSGNVIIPANNMLATSPAKPYNGAANLTNLNPASVTNIGGSQPHENRQPFLVLTFCIALIGIFPSRN
jgi:microcystin-dependent protein